MRRKNLYCTVRALVRLSWEPANLYNLVTKNRRLFDGTRKTVYQQQWTAKRETRAYHDSNTTERSWMSMFKPRLPTLNMQMLSGGNASSQKLSRVYHGSDATDESIKELEKTRKNRQHAHAASLMYAPMERRVDFIVFRSHFVSSIYKARWIINTGMVTVNGKKVNIPSYTVDDGDVVQVDPRVVCTLKKAEDGTLKFNEVPFMQPWMFIPEYLEVNYNTCSTVYLRDPVTRPSRTELPSPFPPEVHGLAYDFYTGKG
ncbi:hypothetical protein IWQ60_000542, partial [Tieghemiomyces parasiticus]